MLEIPQPVELTSTIIMLFGMSRLKKDKIKIIFQKPYSSVVDHLTAYQEVTDSNRIGRSSILALAMRVPGC